MRKLFSIIFSLLYFGIFAQSGNVGIGTSTPLTKLDIAGAIAVEPPTSVSVTADNTALTVGNYSYIKLTSDNTTPSNRTITLSNGLQTGQILMIENTSASTFAVEILDASNVKLAKSPTNIFGGSVTLFVWDGTQWTEIRQVQRLPEKQVFTNTGTLQVFTVPAGVYKIKVKIWGAGGGPGFYNSARYACGGSGGYVAGDIDVTPLENLLIKVGEGGNSTGTGRTRLGYSWNFGDGAAGGATSPTDGNVGCGGGASSIARGATTLAVAGGGGGAAGYPSAAATYQYGGAGGGSTGGNGGAGTSNPSSNGKGGTSLAGGAGGTLSWVNGVSGISLQGGNGGDYYFSGYAAGGGGGGGYFGGGGGAGDNTNTWCGGGGGGSSYTGGLTGSITNTQGAINTTANTFAPAPNNSDVDYLPKVGRGGYVTTTSGNIIYDGGPGLIVITW